MTSGDHPAIEIEDPGELAAVEAGDQAPVPGVRERRDDVAARGHALGMAERRHQALFAFWAGSLPEVWRCRLSDSTSLRNWAISRSSSAIPARDGSTSSPHGVP